jgi:hypothetical protein
LALALIAWWTCSLAMYPLGLRRLSFTSALRLKGLGLGVHVFGLSSTAWARLFAAPGSGWVDWR